MVEGDVFQIGTAIADQITVTLTEDLDIDSYYDIYISALQSGAARNTATWVKLGTYVISDMDTSYEGQTRVVFQDKLVTLDESVLLNTGTLYANLTAMATVSLTQEEQTFLSGISVANAQTMTKRDFIRGCGLLMWENAYITSSGAVSYRIKTTTSQSFGPSVRFNSALADPVTIGPVDVVDDSGAVIFTRGSSSGQRIVIDNSTSPMINLIGGVENLAQYYSTATIPGRGIVDFAYNPLTMTAMSSWQMEPGDVFAYVDKNNVSHTSICTSVAHVLNGASACTSTAQSKQRQSKLIPSQTDEARAIVENLSSGIDIAQSTASEAMPKYGTCSTAASTVTKSVTGISNFNLQLGTRVSLLMTNSNTANEPKLNVNSTGAKYIVTSDGSKLTTSTNGIKAWLAGSMVTFVYTRNNDDTDYVWRIDDCAALTRIQHILTEDVVGTNGWINLADGCFNFGSNKLVFDSATPGQPPTLSLDGTVESTSGHIGGWEIGSHLLSSSSTVSGSTYQAFMQEANGSTRVNSFGVSKTTNGTTTYPFRVTYDGTLYATGANISGTVTTNDLTATGGTIGSWNIGSNLLSTSVTISNTTYTPFMQVPNGDTVVNAFGVTASSGGTTTYPFRVTYDGTLYSTKLNASGGTIGGWTIGNSVLYGETLAYETYGTAIALKNFRTFIQIPDGSSSYYSFGVLNETDNVYPFRVTYDGTLHTEHLDATGGSIGGWNIGSTLLSVDFSDGTYDYQAYIQAPNGTTRTTAFGIKDVTQGYNTFSVDYQGKLTAGSITEGGTALANKYCLKPVGMAAAGSNTPVPTATWTAYTPGGNNNLPNGHRYLCIVNAEFPSSTTGIRALRATIDGTSLGNIATDRRTPISGYSTYCRIEFWIEPGSSFRTLAFEAYQSTGSPQTVTFRYQLIDFGT